MAALQFILIFGSYILAIIFSAIIKVDMGAELEFTYIIFALITFCFAYIFKYGYEIQLDSVGVMYNNQE